MKSSYELNKGEGYHVVRASFAGVKLSWYIYLQYGEWRIQEFIDLPSQTYTAAHFRHRA